MPTQPEPPAPPRLLLFVTDLEIGGTPTVVRELAVRLRDANIARTEVACLKRAGPVADQLASQAIPVTPLNAAGPADLPRVFRQLTRLIRDHQFDGVFSFLIHANAVAACCKPFLPNVRFIQAIQGALPTPRWHWLLQSLVQLNAEKIVVPTPSVAAAAQDYASIEADRIAVIPNAIDVSAWQPDSSRGVASPRTRVAFIGRLDPVKRIPDLIRAFTLCPQQTTLDIIGEGPARPDIIQSIATLNLTSRVSLHGPVADVRPLLATMDVLVLPSQAEGFGLVLIEAMAARVPIVATNAPGIRDVIHHNQTGLLVPIADPPALASAITELLTNTRLRDRLTQAANTEVSRLYDWPIVLPQYARLLN